MIAACRASFAALAIAAAAGSATAQGGGARPWNDSSSLDLVSRAIVRRTAQLADTGLADYKAVAHGYLTFFAQLGEGFPDPPQVVRADELAVEVYWRAPNQSKQRVVGRRDTLLLPTDINYHRDHLAVVQNNFPAIIRLGDGDEVRDVPHPLSVVGREAYDFAVADSLTIRVAGRSWDVVSLDVRPRDDRQPRVVGTMYLDRESGSVVRMSVTFTRAALIDPALEDISVSLDNGLVDGRFWLPRRQEIEIRRRGEWLEFPARGIIRGEWDLCCVETNRGLPRELFVGPEITIASPQELARYPFAGTLRDSLPARILGAGPERPAAALQQRALGLVRGAAITRAARATASARSVSDFVRVNRVEGLALGGGITLRAPGGAHLRGEARYGLDDALLKFRGALSLPVSTRARFTLSAFDEYREGRDAPEMSRLGNSFGAADLGADFTDEYRVSGVGVSLSLGERWRMQADVERVREDPLAVHATPFSGSFRPAFPAERLDATRVAMSLASPLLVAPLGIELRGAARIAFASQFERLTMRLDARRNLAVGELSASARLVRAGEEARSQSDAILGGPASAPGYPAGSLQRIGAVVSRAEWKVPVGGFPLNLGRFGRTRVPVMLVPFVNSVWTSERANFSLGSWHRSAGLGLVTAHDLLRVDVARGLDRNGGWAVYADFGRVFWPIL
jgi:hypothetical protein